MPAHTFKYGYEEYWHGPVVPVRVGRVVVPVTVEQTAVPPVVSVPASEQVEPRADSRTQTQTL